MRMFNELSALWSAPLFSSAFYQDVGLNWRGIGLRVLLLLAVLTWAVSFMRPALSFSDFLNNEAPTALKDFPPIKIDHGKASSPVKQPYILNDDHGKPFFVLDTTGEIKDPGHVGARLLLTETEWVQVNARGVVERKPLSGFPDFEVDKATLLGWMRLGRNLGLPLAYVFCILWTLGYHLVLALAFGGIGMAFNAGFGGKLTFAGAMRIAVMAMIAPILIDTILWVTGIPGGCIAWFLFQGITLGYVAYGVKMVANATKPVAGFPVEQQPIGSGMMPPPDSPFP